jgi:hypothetical protein
MPEDSSIPASKTISGISMAHLSYHSLSDLIARAYKGSVIAFFDYESCTNCEYRLYMHFITHARPRVRLSRRPEYLIYLSFKCRKTVQRRNRDHRKSSSGLSKRIACTCPCKMHHSSWNDILRCQIVLTRSAPVSQTACCEERDARNPKAADERQVVVALGDDICAPDEVTLI